MKKLCFTVLMMIFVSCVGVSAQERCDGYYLSLSGGVSSINEQYSPVFGLRLGMEYSLFVGEVEISYLSAVKDDGFDYPHNNDDKLSTMIAGVNLGVKFVQSERGFLSAFLSGGYSLQEDWHKGHGCDYYDYWCYDYGYCDYNHGYNNHHSRHHEKGYFGIGLAGALDFSDKFGVFAEARYQTIPYEGRGKSRWGLVANVGLRFYF